MSMKHKRLLNKKLKNLLCRFQGPTPYCVDLFFSFMSWALHISDRKGGSRKDKSLYVITICKRVWWVLRIVNRQAFPIQYYFWQMARFVRCQKLLGCYNQWIPFWGYKGWCCQSARCRWAQQKTAPLWQLRLLAWGPEDAATAWITWE